MRMSYANRITTNGRCLSSHVTELSADIRLRRLLRGLQPPDDGFHERFNLDV